MNNSAIEKLLTNLIDGFLKGDKKNAISFENTQGYAVSWDDNVWILDAEKADPLSLSVFEKNPERCKDGDDDYIVATIAKMLDKSPWWVRSFQEGWQGQKNSSMSISGFLLGDKLRRKYHKPAK